MSRWHAAIRNDPRYHAFRAAVLERDEYRCQACGSESQLEADHVVPLAHGGDPFDPDNGRTLCKPCNGKRGTRAVIRSHYVNGKWFATK